MQIWTYFAAFKSINELELTENSYGAQEISENASESLSKLQNYKSKGSKYWHIEVRH